MSDNLLLSVVLACNLGYSFAGFVFSPVGLQPAANHAATTNLKSKGHAMAEELDKALPVSSGPTKQLEAAIDQDRTGEKDDESRAELLAATSLFNAASSESTVEQQAAEDALRVAMSSPSRIGTPDRSIQQNSPSACLPDFTKCPEEWNKNGMLCTAGDAYSGRCAAEADLSAMSVEQKLAFASFCSVQFPCQEDCSQDFRQVCPSLWREVADGVCSAPLQYEGACSSRLDAASMSDEDKHTWSLRCGARWPCAAAWRHKYEDICPEGWSLEFGKVCTAPPGYDGPCEHKAYMSGASEPDKKAFEAACRVEWAVAGNSCVHDYAAACPFGWYRDEGECIAPLMYDTCTPRQSFTRMTPAAKEEWATNCKVEFPCRGRDVCDKTYLSPCPADWYAFNGGLSCSAPSNYAGPCLPVLHGLLDATVEEKMAVEKKCNFLWPCIGEVYAPIVAVGSNKVAPRRSSDPAHYSSASGPIDSSSGAVRPAHHI